MRISKESIFTGLNNFTTFTIADVDFDEYFGFTDQEVRDLLTIMNVRISMKVSKNGMMDTALETWTYIVHGM